LAINATKETIFPGSEYFLETEIRNACQSHRDAATIGRAKFGFTNGNMPTQ
jgi:hypothetical protein